MFKLLHYIVPFNFIERHNHEVQKYFRNICCYNYCILNHLHNKLQDPYYSQRNIRLP